MTDDPDVRLALEYLSERKNHWAIWLAVLATAGKHLDESMLAAASDPSIKGLAMRIVQAAK